MVQLSVGNVIMNPLLVATYQTLAEHKQELCVPSMLSVCRSSCQPVFWPIHLNLQLPLTHYPEREHLAITHNEGKWGSDAKKKKKLKIQNDQIYPIVSHLLCASCGQPPKGSVSFRGESHISQPQKIFLLFNGCGMIDSLELICPWPWRTGAQTEVHILCDCATVALWSNLILMQFLVCLSFIFLEWRHHIQTH